VTKSGSICVVLLVVAPCCGGKTDGDDQEQRGQAGDTGHAAASGGTPDVGCRTGDTSPCDCPGRVGVRVCSADGAFGECVCNGMSADGVGSPECTVAPNCGSCEGCLEQCACERGDISVCLNACGTACRKGYVSDPSVCDSCIARIPPVEVCFNDLQAACECACGVGRECDFGVGCPMSVTCRP
jgi:hypothetical protein